MTSGPPIASSATDAPAAPAGDALVEALCRIARTVAESLDLREVFARVAEAIRPVLPHDFMGLGLLAEDRSRVRIYASALPAELDLGEAAAAYDEALRLDPGLAAAHEHLGATLAIQGKLAEAAAAFRRAIACKPDFATAHNNLGKTLRRLGRPGPARRVSGWSRSAPGSSARRPGAPRPSPGRRCPSPRDCRLPR